MRKEYLTIPGLLALLAAQGADFDRAQLDRMLSQLERSTPPTKFSPGATCYKMATPPQNRIEYLCPVCGERTYYSSPTKLTSLEYARNGVKRLRRLGLDVEVDETAFCWKCSFHPDGFRLEKRLFSARVLPFQEQESSDRHPVRVHVEEQFPDGRCRISTETLFVPRDAIAADGRLAPDTELRLGPGRGYLSVYKIRHDSTLPIRDPEPGDDPEWVRVDPTRLSLEDIIVSPETLTDCEYREMKIPVGNVKYRTPAWRITMGDQTRRLSVDMNDVEVIRAFLAGKNIYYGSQGEEKLLKDKLPRLRQLFGSVLEP